MMVHWQIISDVDSDAQIATSKHTETPPILARTPGPNHEYQVANLTREVSIVCGPPHFKKLVPEMINDVVAKVLKVSRKPEFAGDIKFTIERTVTSIVKSTFKLK